MGLATGTEAMISISIEVEVKVKGEEVIIVAGYVCEEERVGVGRGGGELTFVGVAYWIAQEDGEQGQERGMHREKR